MKIPFSLNILRSKIITVPPPVKWGLYLLSFPLPLRHSAPPAPPPPPPPRPGIFRTSLKSLRKCREEIYRNGGGGSIYQFHTMPFIYIFKYENLSSNRNNDN